MKTIRTRIDQPKFTYDFPQRKEEILFFDIETTGLSPKTSSIYLIGVMFFHAETEEFLQIQWFAERNKDEKQVLASFLEFLNHYHYLYHFNGRTFDIPFILEKCTRHALSLNEHAKKVLTDTTGVFSIDILARVRKLKKFLKLKKCNQKALEHFLGIYREDKFSGGDLIPVYSEYTQMRLLEPDKAGALEKVLLLHNFEDVEMMLSICSLLQYETLFHENSPLFSETALQKTDVTKTDAGFLTLSLRTEVSFPKELTITTPYPQNQKKTERTGEPEIPPKQEREELFSTLRIKSHEVTLEIPILEDTLKFFFADYKNYYYLPEEDMAVHKSVSSFVDDSRREKATKENCYIKKTGIFLPSLIPQKRKKTEKIATLFFKEYGDPLAYYEVPTEPDDPFFKEFFKEQLPFSKGS